MSGPPPLHYHRSIQQGFPFLVDRAVMVYDEAEGIGTFLGLLIFSRIFLYGTLQGSKF